MPPLTVKDFVTAKLAGLPSAARLAVVFDPYADLGLGSTFAVEPTSPKSAGRLWRVFRYDGNDLAFRQQQTMSPGQSELIWVTAPPGSKRDGLAQIELRSLVDVWRRAEAFIDASLPGVLRQLAPEVIWPEGPVWEQAAILSQNLPAVISGWQELRFRLEQPVALDTHTIRALALHCLQPDLPIDRFMFRLDTPSRVLDTYLDLLWRVAWQPDGLKLLQQQAREAPRLELGSDIITWLTLPSSTLALYLYLRRWLGRFRLPHIANHLRGLGLLELDPASLETEVERVLQRWDRDPTWRNQVIRQAEENLTLEAANQVINLLHLDSPAEVLQALSSADTPAAIYVLQGEFFKRALATNEAHQAIAAWAEYRPQFMSSLPETHFKERALTLVTLLDELAFIEAQLRLSPPPQLDLARLLDWYVTHKLYDLEYAHARAGSHLLYLADDQLHPPLESYLARQKKRIKTFLDQLDHALAGLITANWSGYLSHPRLAINILWDTVKRPRRPVTSQARLWVVVFDGMRWDTWARHVKPRLLEIFELVEPEKPYLSLLPSWTMVARTGLLAGKTPEGWRDDRHNFSRDQAHLAARLFDIPRREQSRRLQFFSNLESDRKYNQLHSEVRYPYNILIFNISDDNLHSQRGSLSNLNKMVNSLLDDILQKLRILIEPEDTLVVTSDHGFVELEPEDALPIPDNQRWTRFQTGEAQHPVRYRYLTTHEIPPGLADVFKLNYRGVPDQYSVAVGRRWFKRAESRGAEDRYAHGGLSLAEMTVPGVILKRITEPRIEPVLTLQPAKLEMQEKETKPLTLTVANKGNRPLTGQLTIQTNLAEEPALFQISLSPGQAGQIVYPVTAVYKTRSDKTIDSTQQVKITFDYTDATGKPKKKNRQVPVTVTPRTDVVELDFGGLPDLDI